MKRIVSIRDVKTEVFGAPALVQNVAEAERQFRDLISDSSTLISRHPEDFELYVLGSFDEVSGVIDPGLVRLFCGSDFSKKE